MVKRFNFLSVCGDELQSVNDSIPVVLLESITLFDLNGENKTKKRRIEASKHLPRKNYWSKIDDGRF